MAGQKHFVIVGRTSPAIAHSIVEKFSDATIAQDTPAITRAGNVFQSRFGTFGDGEAIFELFAEGKLSDHPIEQNLPESQKRKILRDMEGAHVTIVHSISGENTSSRALSLLDGVYDLKNEYGVESISLIAPHLPFMRNDRRFKKQLDDGTVQVQRNAIASKNYARRLKNEGVDQVIGFEAHSKDGVANYQEFFGNRATFINTGDFFAEDFAKKLQLVDLQGDWAVAVGAPDGLNKPKDYGIARAKSFGMALYAGTKYGHYKNKNGVEEIPYMFGIHKERINANKTKIVQFYGEVEGKHCVLVDDILSSGNTTIQAAQELKRRGAAKVTSITTHAVVPGDALKNIMACKAIDQVCLSDTIPGAREKAIAGNFDRRRKLVIKTIAPIVDKEIGLIHGDELQWAYPLRELAA